MSYPRSFAKARRGRLAQALVAAALAACPVVAIAQPVTPPAPASGGAQYTVTMSNMAYGAPPSGLKVGDTIVWVNNDSVMHSVTARDHSFDLRLNPGQRASLTLAHAGRIPYYCLFHPAMRGSLDIAAQ